MYKVELTPRALKDLKKLQKKTQQQIADTINTLVYNPRGQNCKKLQSGVDVYRIRSGDYRVVYSIHDKTVCVDVLLIAHRREVYERLKQKKIR